MMPEPRWPSSYDHTLVQRIIHSAAKCRELVADKEPSVFQSEAAILSAMIGLVIGGVETGAFQREHAGLILELCLNLMDECVESHKRQLLARNQ